MKGTMDHGPLVELIDFEILEIVHGLWSMVFSS